MKKKYQELKISDFLNELSERKGVPGGGSVAALEGAIASGLHLMVLQYSDKQMDPELRQRLLRDQKRSFEILLDCIDKDIEAFSSLMSSFSSDKENVQERYKAASRVPMKVAEESVKCLLLMEIGQSSYNPKLITDVGGAVNAFRSAALSGFLNARINLAHIEDPGFKGEIKEQIDRLAGELDRVSRIFDDFLESVLG